MQPCRQSCLACHQTRPSRQSSVAQPPTQCCPSASVAQPHKSGPNSGPKSQAKSGPKSDVPIDHDNDLDDHDLDDYSINNSDDDSDNGPDAFLRVIVEGTAVSRLSCANFSTAADSLTNTSIVAALASKFLTPCPRWSGSFVTCCEDDDNEEEITSPIPQPIRRSKQSQADEEEHASNNDDDDEDDNLMDVDNNHDDNLELIEIIGMKAPITKQTNPSQRATICHTWCSCFFSVDPTCSLASPEGVHHACILMARKSGQGHYRSRR